MKPGLTETSLGWYNKICGGITKFVGWCTSKVNHSTADGESCGRKATRDTDLLEITKVSWNGLSGIKASAPNMCQDQ